MSTTQWTRGEKAQNNKSKIARQFRWCRLFFCFEYDFKNKCFNVKSRVFSSREKNPNRLWKYSMLCWKVLRKPRFNCTLFWMTREVSWGRKQRITQFNYAVHLLCLYFSFVVGAAVSRPHMDSHRFIFWPSTLQQGIKRERKETKSKLMHNYVFVWINRL